jgi:hypothetical protein
MSTNFAKEFKLYESLFSGYLNEDTVNDTGAEQLYQMDLEAYLRDTDEYYTDADDQTRTTGIYQYTGELSNIITKLNKLAKKYDIAMLYIYKANTDNCVFSADTIDVEADETDVDTIVHVFHNECINESEPFMKQFTIDTKGKYADTMNEAVSTQKRYVLATKEKPRINERVFVYLDGNYNYRLGALLDLAVSDYKDSISTAREEANLALDTITAHRLYILQANNLKCVDSFDYLEEA